MPRLAVGLQRGVIDATDFEARLGLQPANGRSLVVAIWARSSARLCVARISAAKKSLSPSTPRSIAWPALSGVTWFLVIDRLPFWPTRAPTLDAKRRPHIDARQPGARGGYRRRRSPSANRRRQPMTPPSASRAPAAHLSRTVFLPSRPTRRGSVERRWLGEIAGPHARPSYGHLREVA